MTISAGFGAVFASNVLTPLWLQSYMGYTATWAGYACAWSGVLAVFAAPMAGLLSQKTDPRRLIFIRLVWLAGIMMIRAGATTEMTYWQVSIPLLLFGLGLPFFFVPLTALALGSVEEHETASAAGLMNFIRTLSGAVATSIVTTTWEDKTSYMHAELSGLVDSSGDAVRADELWPLGRSDPHGARQRNAGPERDAGDERDHVVRRHRVLSCRAHHLARATPDAGGRSLEGGPLNRG